MTRTFKLKDGSKVRVRKLQPAPDWAWGNRLYGRLGGWGWGGTKVILYFEGSAKMGRLVGIWTNYPRKQIYSSRL